MLLQWLVVVVAKETRGKARLGTGAEVVDDGAIATDDATNVATSDDGCCEGDHRCRDLASICRVRCCEGVGRCGEPTGSDITFRVDTVGRQTTMRRRERVVRGWG